MKKKPLLVCVVGATGIGKTALAIKIANFFSTEILSADSRQFFKEMEIGTAVPSPEELAAAPHHFIQHKSIFEKYTVGDFEKEALLKLSELFQKHSIVVMVGGSGLYVDAVVKGLDTFPKVDVKTREVLNQELSTYGIEKLQKELKDVDSTYYNNIDIDNPRRVIRALEVSRSSGKPYSSFLNKNKNNRAFNTLFIGITAERPIIYNRINRRVDLMVTAGLIEEAKNLEEHKELNALQTVGYRELFKYFDGFYTKEVAVEEIKKNTRRFAKRQGTWYKKNNEISWFNYDTPISKVIDFINEKTP
ncbi:tRNA dimethylallyltransferase [Patiriisocius marinistellae]|uniref:tRNA dimethylallyltransferase n=1 Tax=Patiriisocius marinistellae TaxID=2494560 RepID=A0A5J4FZL8_9FLAO|nr:tRNA (adenosine(37)-N6)-dimethylallyltransferase MiaA [Patiriisocius marinistellae]GEQ86644.1 tRNA dimethylallyltransferase [Patiriisocius marinistellae]